MVAQKLLKNEQNGDADPIILLYVINILLFLTSLSPNNR
jgi:hypothetical protein